MQELDHEYQSINDVGNREVEAANYATSFLYQVSRSVVEKSAVSFARNTFFSGKSHELSVTIDRCYENKVTTHVPGEAFLESMDIDYSVWGFWQNQVALLGIIAVCMTLAYVQLLRINRWK
ncbi:hypothetical protein GOODEAATRI_016980 [Goodea atripinnis]|uniref:Uncharacterized protein n=1 Tax=Goodea atripinnis TaxID=208336 RepID=A0ABV0N3G0_9TELE